MLLIDGVKYEEWIPTSEDKFEELVKEHASEIFGEASIYLDIKQKLKSATGVGSIPDGFVIAFGESVTWYVVEMELSTHYLYEHIVSQIGRFIRGIGNPSTQRNLVNTIYEAVIEDDFNELRLKKAIEPVEIYKFISDIISKQPILTIIIERKTPDLEEALNTLNYPHIKVIEFQTLVREGVELPVHAHLFEPICHQPSESKLSIPIRDNTTVRTSHPGTRITLGDLIRAGIIIPNQSIYGLEEGKRFEATVLEDGTIVLQNDGGKYESLSTAAMAIVNYSVNGWVWWRIRRKDGSECKLADLRRQLIQS